MIDMKITKISKNAIDMKEYVSQENVRRSPDIRYGRIVFATDADPDGNHIVGLMLNNFNFKWQSLLETGMVCRLKTPIIRVKKGRDTFEFFTMEEFDEWDANQSNKNYTLKYLKGLGGNTTADFKKFMHEEEFIIPLVMENDEDKRLLGIAFGDAKDKKVWLYGDAE